MSHASSKLVALCAGLLVSFAAPAWAADIASTFGRPGSWMWNGACSSGVQPGGTSQLGPCAGGATCLHRVVLDSAEFPQATCSDGTPGAFYVRAGSGEDVNRWVIHLQGGSACRDYESCLERWCGTQGDLPYTANKMSSDWTGNGVTDLEPHVVGPGMASANPANAFATWTHVWAYYCSSDSWQGRATDVPMSGPLGTFHVDARGHTILTAIRKMLRKSNAAPQWLAAGGYGIADLDSATDIVFTGTSAGATGAIANADWFLAPFTSANRSLVLDGNFGIGNTVLRDHDVWIDDNDDGEGDLQYDIARTERNNDDWATGYRADIDAFTDESCRDHYEPLGRMDICSEFSSLLLINPGAPLIETPTFVRFDLSDSVVSDVFTQHPNREDFSLLVGGWQGTPATIQDFREMARASLLEVYDDRDVVSGLIAPRCGKHVGLENGTTFMVDVTPDTDEAFSPPALVAGSGTTAHDALWTWLDVGSPGPRVDIRRLDTDFAGARFSTCN